ncbi:MAG: aconitate hydratase, partial [Planctomycetes bacterium]|nr:aconitate hydratase [Planctomycetota bacterium]
DGQLAALEAIGATVLANACGPCIGQWKRTDVKKGDPNAILTSFNRNFPERNDGSSATLAFIASPEVVLAYALSGRLDTNPLRDPIEGEAGTFRLDPPPPAPEVPPAGFATGQDAYEAPLADGSGVALDVRAGSERLQLLEPFPAWDGRDAERLPVLLKARGKCTTDHISPAGPWLRFRGHLDRISDNLFLGAVNAFTGKAGCGRDPLTGDADVPFPKAARNLKGKGVRWVVIGDENYGEGSSREHAAMEPRHLGCAAVIVRSFARIHESNLKKQGVLPLTFAEGTDYDRVGERDRISIRSLARLAPGKPIEAMIHHDGGAETRISLAHTLNPEQIQWWKAGSALNVLRGAPSKGGKK